MKNQAIRQTICRTTLPGGKAPMLVWLLLLPMGVAYFPIAAGAAESNARDETNTSALAFETEPGGKNEHLYIPLKRPDGTNTNMRWFGICPTEEKAVGVPVNIALTSDSNKVTFWKTSSDAAATADQITSISFATGETVSKIVYIRGETVGNTVLHFRDAAGGAQLAADLDVTVVKVESLLPDKGAEVDDGDGNDDTKLFVVDISDTPGDVVTVTATPNPPLAESDLPAFWTLTGGTGASKLTRTISQTMTSKSLLTCTCGNSSKVTTIYVVRCRFHAYSEKGALGAGNPGHGWWKLALQPASANALLPVADRIWVNIEIGYFSLNWNPVGPGYVRVGAQGHTPTAQYYWDITFSALAAGVTYGRLLSASPGTYSLTTHNCVHETISAGAAAGVVIHTTPASSFSPDGLHDWLIALPPP